MKKFNLSEYRGKDIVTRGGKEVRILTTTRDVERFPVVAIIENKHFYAFTEDGKFYDDDRDSEFDLFLK